jgi:SAM-dependent methyltransferase
MVFKTARPSLGLSAQVRAWSIVSLALALGLLAAALALRTRPGIPFYERPALSIALWEAIALAVLALVVPATARFFRSPEESASPEDALVPAPRRPYLTLFIISFVALIIELVLIRYSNSQIRIFSFYKNVPLIASFLGLGLGCYLAKGNVRHITSFLLWLIPLAVFLSAGSMVVSNALGKHAAIGSSEQILGAFIPGEAQRSHALQSQLLMAMFCLVVYVVVTLLFILLGRLLGESFERVRRLPGYTMNLLGSLAGILTFVLLSYLETPPWIWFAVGLAPLLWWYQNRRQAAGAALLVMVTVAAVYPSYGETIWSRYQKLVGHPIGAPGQAPSAYLVEISDVFYQVAVDRRPEVTAGLKDDPFANYDDVYRHIQAPERVLVVGAGTGNDVAAALRAGAEWVDAVDIDPAIVDMGRRSHPEHPYDDPRVHVIIDDARHVFGKLAPGSYDVVVFGLLDSHTQLGMSSVRLDNYVFTRESFAAASRLARPGGHIVVTAVTANRWFLDRFVDMLQSTVHGPVQVYQQMSWVTYIAPVGSEAGGEQPVGYQDSANRTAPADPIAPARLSVLPSDDWPFLYLPQKGIPQAYLWVVGCLLLASIVILRKQGLGSEAFGGHHGHFFFLGAAFLLMEVHAINRLALFFGTTWLVSAVTIALVLVLVVLANLSTMLLRAIPYSLAYVALALSLGASYAIRPGTVLGHGTGMVLCFGMVLLLPVFFAGLIFARSFRSSEAAPAAMGANIMGSVVGGWMEYSTMAFGMRALVLLAGLFYALSLLWLLLARRKEAVKEAAGI